jgi:hypothetical protein
MLSHFRPSNKKLNRPKNRGIFLECEVVIANAEKRSDWREGATDRDLAAFNVHPWYDFGTCSGYHLQLHQTSTFMACKRL